jgi:hypothetical protein
VRLGTTPSQVSDALVHDLVLARFDCPRGQNAIRQAACWFWELVTKRNWIDLPLRFGSGRRAILSFEKGSPGAEISIQL